MADERFRRETDLLATVRNDGWTAVALDTNHVWDYLHDIGWVHRSRTVHKPNSLDLPITFANGAFTPVANIDIPGGALGANGWVTVTVDGYLQTTAGRQVEVDLYINGALAASLATSVIPSSGGNDTYFESTSTVRSNQSESLQFVPQRFEIGSSSGTAQASRNRDTMAFDSSEMWTLDVYLTLSFADTAALVESTAIEIVYQA